MLHSMNAVRAGNVGRWSSGVLRQVFQPLVVAMSTLEWIARVANQRRALRELDDQQLRDIGLTRADALREAGRPFWDVPPRAVVEGSRSTGNNPTPRRHDPRGLAGSQLPSAAFPSG